MYREFVPLAGVTKKEAPAPAVVKRTYRPAQQFTCAQCSKPFTMQPSNRPLAAAYCSQKCAAQAREAAAGHKSIETECGYCGKPIKRPQSQVPGKAAFCNRAHYLAYRHGKTLPEGE